MFGSSSADHTLMQSDLINERWIFIRAVLLGAGFIYLQRSQYSLFKITMTSPR